MTTREIQRHALAWRRRLWARETMFAAGAGLFVFALVIVVAPSSIRPALAIVTAILAFLGTLGGRLARVAPWKIDAPKLARHLDRQHPELEESSVLWLRAPEGLSLVEKLQLMRLDRAFTKLPQAAQSPAAPPTGTLRRAARWLVVSVLLVIIAGAWDFSHPSKSLVQLPTSPPAGKAKTTSGPAVEHPARPPRIERTELIVAPPSYTQHPRREQAALSAEIEEGSTVTWRLTISGDLHDIALRFGESGRDALSMNALADGRFEATRVVTDSTLYAIAASYAGGENWAPSEIYSLKVLKDRPPTLRFIEPAVPRTEVRPTAAITAADRARVVVRVAGVDDYGLLEAHLVATVAKGSGEAVKFREQIIEFDPQAAPAAPQITREFTKTLDLSALGLEPGDELYFHVAARDNREPDANVARSETRFILLKGPDDKVASPGIGVNGVNLVPPYFRSQRQLIIDTEKLVADRPTLSDSEFRQRSNELGIDQQLLRLRYGQFLGEELEEGAGAHTDSPDGGAVSTDASGVPLDMMHQHDRGSEDSEIMASRVAEAPKPAGDVPPSPAEVIEPYVDQHDSQDEATFFDHPTKDSLRGALKAMWESEGYLRTARPAEALPAENRALEILKALQQSARAYVQRVGFEPAPLKIAERRLQGDVAKVERLARADESPQRANDLNQPVSEALRVVWWQRVAGNLTAPEIQVLRHAEPRLMEVATTDPDAALAGLQALRRLIGGNANVVVELPALERALWKLLPAAQPLPRRATDSSPDLSRLYFRSLQSEEAKP
jgi:hypothetical protein